MAFESTSNGQAAPEAVTSSATVAATGAVLGGIAALSCCVMPLAFVVVGVSGAWIANLTALSPYQPVFIALAVGSILYGHWANYRARRACAASAACARPPAQRLIDTGLWAGTLFVVVAVAANYAAPLLL